MQYAHGTGYMRRHIAQQRLLKELSGAHTITFPSDLGGEPTPHPNFSEAIRRKDPRCFLEDGRVLFIPRHPYLCSAYNRRSAWADLNLRLVCGSLGFGLRSDADPAPWYEFGNPEYTTDDDFMAGHPADWNWHVWLEDGGGRVWDVCDAFWHDLAAARGHRILIGDALTTAVIRGETVEALQSQKGLHYAPAPRPVQRALLDTAQRTLSPYYEFLR